MDTSSPTTALPPNEKNSGNVPPPTTSGGGGGEAATVPAVKRARTSTDVVERDKDFELPLASINKILRAVMPDTQPTKEAKAAFQKAAGLFILYVTACANDFAKDGKRSTIQAPDVFAALTELGFGQFLPVLEKALEDAKAANVEKKVKKVMIDNPPAAPNTPGTVTTNTTATSSDAVKSPDNNNATSSTVAQV